MSEYTPDEFAVRGAYNYARGASADSDAVLDAEFDRFIAKVKADALREAADDLAARSNAPWLIAAADRWGGYYGGVRIAMQTDEVALRLRADRIEEAGL